MKEKKIKKSSDLLQEAEQIRKKSSDLLEEAVMGIAEVLKRQKKVDLEKIPEDHKAYIKELLLANEETVEKIKKLYPAPDKHENPLKTERSILLLIVDLIDSIAIILDENEKLSDTFRLSSHLLEQTLKETRGQLSIWDNTLENVDSAIGEVERVDLDPEIEGVDLTTSEHKIVISLGKLLEAKSQTDNPEDPTYYTGNAGGVEVKTGSKEAPGEITIAPRIYCSLYELAKEYKGGDNPSGRDIDNVERILDTLREKKFQFNYKQIIKGKKGTEIRTVKGARHLLYVDIATKEVKTDSKTQETRFKIITLNPIYRDQIAGKFVLYPGDYIKRVEDAWGNRNPSPIVFNLANYLNHIRSANSKNKNDTIEHRIYFSNLYRKLDPKTLDQGKRGRVEGYTEKAIEVCKNIKLLKEVEETTGKTGEKMYVFQIYADWK